MRDDDYKQKFRRLLEEDHQEHLRNPKTKSSGKTHKAGSSGEQQEKADGKEKNKAADDDEWTRGAQRQSEPEPPPEPEWPAPITLTGSPGLLGDIVSATMPTTEADLNAVLLQHLLFFGNAIGIGPHTPYCLLGKVVHRTNLSALIVGELAYARKGTATADVRAIYERVDPHWCSRHIRSGLSSGEGLIRAVQDEVVQLDDQGNPKVLTAASDTKNILVVESEFGVVLTNMQRQGNNLADLIKKAWDGGPLETMTRNNSMRASDHLISLIAQDTTVSLAQKLPLVSTQDGFANRMLMACVRRTKLLSNPPEMPEAKVEELARRLREAIELARTRGRMQRSETGQRAWDDIYRRLNEPKPGLYGAVVSRGAMQTHRIAMLFALLDLKPAIEWEHFVAALAVWRYCAASAFYLFGEKQTDAFTDRVLDELRYAPAGLARTDLHLAFGRNITKGALSKALARLLRDGLVRVERRLGQGGRLVDVWIYQAGRQP